MATYNFSNSVTFQYDVDTTSDTATLGSATGSGIVMGTGDDIVYLGGAYQTATLGVGGGPQGTETFIVGTDGSASHNVVADSAQGQLSTAYLEGNNATLEIFGGTLSSSSGVLLLSQAVVLQSGIDIPQAGGDQAGIAHVVIDNSATYLVDDNDPAYNNVGADTTITAGNGNDIFVLDNAGYQAVDTLIAGNGNDTVTIDSGARQDIVSLGSGTNTVDIQFGTQLQLNSRIYGGSGASNTLVIEGSGAAVMGSGVFGFKTVEFGFTSAAVLTTSGTDHNLTVEGTIFGGDTIVLDASTQSYLGDFGNLGLDPFTNSVTLDGGGLAAGVTIDGGSVSDAIAGGNVLNIDSPGAYNFNTATVENFKTVNINSSGVNLVLNAGAYEGVNINAGSGSVTANVLGNATDIDYVISGGTSTSFETFTASSFNGGTGGFEDLIIQPSSYVDLSGAALSNFQEIDINAGATLVLSTAQIQTLSSVLAGTGTLEFDTGATTSFNVESLGISSFITGGGAIDVVVNNSTNDTIFGASGIETIDLTEATGNVWVNGGSGIDTYLIGPNSGSASVLITGNGSNTFVFDGLAPSSSVSVTYSTGDTFVGPTSGTANIEVGPGLGASATETVDFTDATFENFSAAGDIITVESYATAIFTYTELNSLTSTGLINGPGTLEVVANSATVTLDTWFSAFTGNVVVEATSESASIDTSALTQSVTLVFDVSSGSGTFDAPATITPGTLTALMVEANTNFSGTNFGTTLSDIQTVEIAAGATATFAAAEFATVSAPLHSADIFDYTTIPPTPASNAHLVIDVDTASSEFTQSNLVVETDPNQSTTTFVYAFDETIDVSSSGTTIDLSSHTSQAYLITVDEMNGATTNTVLAGTEAEDLFGSTGTDLFVFAVADATPTVPVVIDDIIDGGGGSETLQVGSTAFNLVIDNFQGSTITGVQNTVIFSGAEALFASTQIDGTTVTVHTDSALLVHVAETSDLFSLQTVGSITPIFTLDITNATSAAVILVDNMTGPNTIYAGSGVETIFDGQQSASIHAGSGVDTIVVRDGGGGVDNLFAGTGGEVVFDFTYTGGDTVAPYYLGGVVNAPTHVWNDAGASSAPTFHVEDGAINGTAATEAAILISGNTDLTGATISGIGGTVTALAASYTGAGSFAGVVVEAGASVVFTEAELAALSSTATLTAASNSPNPAGVVIDHTTGAFAPASVASLDLTNWSGSVTIDVASTDTGATINATGLDSGQTTSGFFASDGQTGGVYIYGAAGDTIIGTGLAGDYIQGAGGGTHIEVDGGTDATLLAGGGNNNLVEFESTATSATGDIIHGGGGMGETLQIDGFATDFSGMSQSGLQAIEDIFVDNTTTSSVYHETFSASGLAHDQAFSPSTVEVTDNAATTDSVVFEVNGEGGDVNLSALNTTGFSHSASGGSDAIYIDDISTGLTSSVTVIGANNGVNTESGTEAYNNIAVEGHGDTVVVGTGYNDVFFGNFASPNEVGVYTPGYNAANDVVFNASALNTGSANNQLYLAQMGDLVSGLKDGAGYVELAGYTLTSATGGIEVNPGLSSSALLQLNGPQGFNHYSLIEDTDSINTAFVSGTSGSVSIVPTGVEAAAADIAHYFIDTAGASSSGPVEQGFVTVTDYGAASSDVAIFYVNTTGGGTGGEVQQGDIHLIGVMHNAEITSNGVIGTSFFHIG